MHLSINMACPRAKVPRGFARLRSKPRVRCIWSGNGILRSPSSRRTAAPRPPRLYSYRRRALTQPPEGTTDSRESRILRRPTHNERRGFEACGRFAYGKEKIECRLEAIFLTGAVVRQYFSRDPR